MKKQTVLITAILFLTTLTAAEGSAVEIETELVTKEPTPLQAGEYANIWIEVKNSGDTEASNVDVELKENYPFSVEEGERGNWSFDSLERGETRQIRAQVRVDNKAVQGENELKLRTETSNQVGIEHKIPVEVRVDDTALVINSIDFPERVTPGATNSMDIELENRANGYFRNVDVNANIESEDLTAIGSSRERVQLMDPMSTETVSFDINVDEDADNGVYSIPLDFRYQNEMGDVIETTQNAGLVVGGEPQLTAGIENTDIRTPGTRDTVTFNVINQGDGQASFVNLYLEGSDSFEVLSESNEYIGSMISDDYQTAEFEVYVEDDAESLEFPLNLEYQNEQGERVNQTLNVERQLYTSDELRRYGLSDEGTSRVLAGLVLVALVAGIYYWRRRKSGELEELNE